MKDCLSLGIFDCMETKRKIDKARGERIKHVRTRMLGIKSQERLAEVLSHETGIPITRGAVGNWELGKEVSIGNLKALAELSGASLDWLAYNAGEKPTDDERAKRARHEGERNRVPLLGYVRAGAEAFYYAAADNPLDWVPPVEDWNEKTAAVQIQGDSLGSLFDQWLVYYDDVRSPVTPDLIGRLCVVALPDDRVLIKQIRRSKGTPTFFDLHSNMPNEPVIEGVEILWAALVKNMVPR
jgi:hypothetical protein